MLWMTQTHILSNHFIVVDVMYDSNQTDFTHTERNVSMLPPIKTDMSRNLPLGCDAKTTDEGKKKKKKTASHSAVNVKERCEPAPSPLLHLKNT